MLDWLISIDKWLFILLNYKLANPVFDVIMPIITYRWTLRGVLALILVYLLIFDGKRGRFAAIATILAVAIADQTAAGVVKPLVGRIRPCHVIEPINLLVNCSQGLSFPSAHATNSAAVAAVLSLIYPRAKWYLISFAAVVSYSRIAVGVHFPYDVIAGALIGAAAGIAVYQFYRLAAMQWLGGKKPPGSANSAKPEPQA